MIREEVLKTARSFAERLLEEFVKLQQRQQRARRKARIRRNMRTEWKNWVQIYRSLSDLDRAIQWASQLGAGEGAGKTLRPNQRLAFSAIATILNSSGGRRSLERLRKQRDLLFAYIGWWLTILEKGAPRP